MDKVITTDQSESPEEFTPNASADPEPNEKPRPTKTQKPCVGAKPKASPKKTSLTPKSAASLARSKNLPPSALLSKASTNTSGNGGDAASVVTASMVIETHLINAIADGPVIKAKFRDQMGAIRRELAASDQIEALLVERIALCWARLQFLEAAASQCYAPGATLTQATHWEDRLTQAHGRFLKAIMALERVRKLRRRAPMSGAAISALLGPPKTLGDLPRIRLSK